MTMPAGANDLTLGGALDLSALTDEDCTPNVRNLLEKLSEWWIGAGCRRPKGSRA